MKNDNLKLGDCILPLVLTILIGFLAVILDYVVNKDTGGIGIAASLLWSVIILPIYAVFNLIYLLLIHYSGLSRKLLSNWKLITLEATLYLGLYGVIAELISNIPYDYRVRKYYFDFPFDHLYSFIALTLILIIYKMLLRVFKSPSKYPSYFSSK